MRTRTLRLCSVKRVIEKLEKYGITQIEAGFIMGAYAFTRVMSLEERFQFHTFLFNRAILPAEEFDYEKRVIHLITDSQVEKKRRTDD